MNADITRQNLELFINIESPVLGILSKTKICVNNCPIYFSQE